MGWAGEGGGGAWATSVLVAGNFFGRITEFVSGNFQIRGGVGGQLPPSSEICNYASVRIPPNATRFLRYNYFNPGELQNLQWYFDNESVDY